MRQMLAILCLVMVFGAARAAADLSQLTLETLAIGLADPVAITHVGSGDPRLFITLQAGQVVIYENGQVQPQPFLDIRGRVGSGGERGLLSVAFHPGYSQNGFFFVNYTNLGGATIIARFRVSANANVADAGSEAVLLTITQPFSNHNGGQLQFGSDGFLYVGMGDGGSANDPGCRAQDGTTLLGKMLRLDVGQNVGAAPFHGIPADNPFLGRGDVEDEIWALGLRNPWRFSFDRQTGDLFVGDVGQGNREEIDFEPALSAGGRNYGWKVMEGNFCLASTAGCGTPVPSCNAAEYTAPIIDYGRAGGRCAVIGGYVYRGQQIPELFGHYLYGDLCAGTLWAAERADNSWQPIELMPTLPRLASFGENAAGEIFLVARDVLYRLMGPAVSMPGEIGLSSATFEVQESAGAVTVTVGRDGGSDGEVTVDYATSDDTAAAGSDYQAASGTLIWASGDSSPKSFAVTIFDDASVEGGESFGIQLDALQGGAELGRSVADVAIVDDDVDSGPCVPGANTLCLNDGRFRVQVAWRTLRGEIGFGEAIPLSGDAGYFWFFDIANPEIFVKLLDACVDPFNHFWVFAAGLTDVETSLTVVDTQTGAIKRYDKLLGAGFDPIRDTTAFATCP